MDIEEENISPKEIDKGGNEKNSQNELDSKKMDIEKEKNNCIIKNNNIIINKNILNLGPQNHILFPRDYQLQIFEKAKNKNSIIYLDTGKGKTFISIMLMSDLLGIKLPVFEKPEIDNSKKIIFLVCDTALIEQQKNTISLNLNLEVGTIQGKKNKKAKNDLTTFRKMWESYNLFVAIPSIVYNADDFCIAENGSCSVSLKVNWIPITYTVKYNCNAGTGSTPNSTHTYGQAKNLSNNQCSRSGYSFLGWSTSSTATTATYANQASVTNLSNTQGAVVNLYAVWKQDRRIWFTYTGNFKTSDKSFDSNLK